MHRVLEQCLTSSLQVILSWSVSVWSWHRMHLSRCL